MTHDRARLERLAADGDPEALRALERLDGRRDLALDASLQALRETLGDVALRDRCEGLVDPDPGVRALALEELAVVPELSPRQHALLIDAGLHDPVVDVRLKAVDVMGHQLQREAASGAPSSGTLDRLIAALGDGQFAVRDRASLVVVTADRAGLMLPDSLLGGQLRPALYTRLAERGVTWPAWTHTADALSNRDAELAVASLVTLPPTPATHAERLWLVLELLIRCQSPLQVGHHHETLQRALCEWAPSAALVRRRGPSIVRLARHGPLPDSFVAALGSTLLDEGPFVPLDVVALGAVLCDLGALPAALRATYLSAVQREQLDDEIRLALFAQLMSTEPWSTVWPAAREVLRDPRHPALRRNLLTHLLNQRALPDEARAELLSTALHECDDTTRTEALRRLHERQLPDEVLRELVGPLLEHTSLQVVRATVEAVARCGVDAETFDPRLTFWMQDAGMAEHWQFVRRLSH